MFNSLEKKVEEIRKQPEHIRMRWAIGLSLAVMVFVLIIWFVSLKQLFRNSSFDNQEDSFQQQFEQLKEQAPSIKDSLGETNEILNQGKESLQDMQPEN